MLKKHKPSRSKRYVTSLRWQLMSIRKDCRIMSTIWRRLRRRTTSSQYYAEKNTSLPRSLFPMCLALLRWSWTTSGPPRTMVAHSERDPVSRRTTRLQEYILAFPDSQALPPNLTEKITSLRTTNRAHPAKRHYQSHRISSRRTTRQWRKTRFWTWSKMNCRWTTSTCKTFRWFLSELTSTLLTMRC